MPPTGFEPAASSLEEHAPPSGESEECCGVSESSLEWPSIRLVTTGILDRILDDYSRGRVGGVT